LGAGLLGKGNDPLTGAAAAVKDEKLLLPS